MKTKTWRWGLTALALVSTGCLIWYGCYQTARANVNYSGSALNLNTTAGIQFSLANLPNILDNNANGDNTTKDMRVFFSLGDGTFWMGKYADFNSQIFPYTQMGAWKPYAELTSIYDDDKNPTGRVAAPEVNITTVNVSSLPPLRVAMGTQTVKLQCNREPKPGDSLLYIITYEHNEYNRNCPGAVSGILNFTYDPNVLVFKKLETFYGETEQAGSASATNNTGQVLLSLPVIAAGTQHSVFVRVAVKETVAEGRSMAAPVAQVNWSDPSPGQNGICSSATSSLQNQQIVSSHDPNRKIIRLEKICETDNLAKFTVTFQNDGSGPTKKVVVEDELDMYLADTDPDVTEWSTPQEPIVERIGPRLYKFVFNPLRLEGLNDPRYGTDFTEEATKASFTFTCALNTDFFPTDFPACNAVMNRAKIFFDCNPPVITNDALLPVNCVACDTCATTVTTWIISDTLVFDDTIPLSIAVKNKLQTLPEQDYRFHWYPCSDVSDWDAKFPIYTGKNNNRLTLVASEGGPACRREVLHFVFPDPCKLKIEVDETNVVKGSCAGANSGFLVARVTGAASPSWNSCVQKDTIHIPVQAGKTRYYIGVTDLSTGCFADSLYTINGPEPLVVDDVPGNCRADLTIRGGVPPYTVHWTWQAGGTSHFSNTAGTSLGLRGKQNVQAAVTDANGCFVTFTPTPNTCPRITRQELLLLVAAAAIALLFPILRYMRGRRRLG